MSAFSSEQIQQLRSVFREELADAGLRLDSAEHQDEAREDFRFMRRLRKWVEGAASKVGMAFILAIVSGIVWLIVKGAQVFGAANGT